MQGYSLFWPFYGAAYSEWKATEVIQGMLREQESTDYTGPGTGFLMTRKAKLMKHSMFLLKVWKPCFHLHLFYCINLGKNYFFQNSHSFLSASAFRRHKKRKERKNVDALFSTHAEINVFPKLVVYCTKPSNSLFYNQSKLRQLLLST